MNPVCASILMRRSSGVLLHITSLPGAHGSGDLGEPAYHFIDWLASAGQHLWQILPLAPAGAGNSPYDSACTFAANPLLVDLDELARCGWLAPEPLPAFDAARCDFDRVRPYRMARLHQAWQGFAQKASAADWTAFEHFRTQQAHWLEGYALFMALETRHGRPWTQWPQALRQCQPQALAEAAVQMTDDLGFFSFVQWRFAVQWQRLRAHAHRRGVLIVGDVPIFVAHHSADVWLNSDQFLLDALGEPSVVAGVPPDHFSDTGQRWGNPLYNWDAMAADGFSWWQARMTQLLSRVDLVRMDHFRGFESCWEIPAAEPTAALGCWRAGPGARLFDALAGACVRHGFGQSLPVIAEDLGVITPEVTALRRQYGLPGMRVLQFAFGDTANNPNLPHNFEAQTVAYTGTHDNDTALGWWHSAGDAEREAARSYLGPLADVEIHWAMMISLSQSVANTVLFPLQDVLGLDSAHCMNTPGQAESCWKWRFDWAQVAPDVAQRLAAMTRAHGRNLAQPGATSEPSMDSEVCHEER
jgi:4-alpha-glucanotransferase